MNRPSAPAARANPFAPLYKQCNTGSCAAKMAAPPPGPVMVDVELTNHCNYRCLFCPTGIGQHKRAKGYLSRELYFRFLDQTEAAQTALRFIRWGEPTLHPHWLEFIGEAKRRGRLVHLTTNGSLLSSGDLAALLDMGLDSIKFSFQGVDRETYRAARNKDFFRELLEQAGALWEARGERPLPHIHISTSVTSETPEQAEAFRALAGQRADMVTVGRTNLMHMEAEGARLSPEEAGRLAAMKKHDPKVRLAFECHEIFDKLSLNWDGTVSACCRDYDNLTLVGDLAKQDLAAIWHGEPLRELRRLILDGRHGEHELCRTCYDVYGVLTGESKTGSRL